MQHRNKKNQSLHENEEKTNMKLGTQRVTQNKQMTPTLIKGLHL
jgi:hypothetical protein